MPDAIDLPKTNPCTWTTAEDGRDGMSPQDEQDKILCTWIGHAGCHFQIPVPGSTCGDRITVLTDPVLSQRCSPVQFMGPARLQKAPTTVEEMASSSHSHVWPDVLVISHNHYDHLDYNTIKAIVSCDKHPVPVSWMAPTWVMSMRARMAEEAAALLFTAHLLHARRRQILLCFGCREGGRHRA